MNRKTVLRVLGGATGLGFVALSVFILKWLWMILFNRFVTLTEQPIDLAAGMTPISLEEPISAFNSGARLYVDITSMVPGAARNNIFLAREWVETNVPVRCLSAILTNDGLRPVNLEFEGHTSYSKGSVWLSLHSSNALPVRKHFNELAVSSCMPLSEVRILWSNHGK